MKRFLALLICLILVFALVACDSKKSSGNGGADRDDGGAADGTAKKTEVSFYVTYNSVKIELGADAKAVVAALGTPKSSAPMGNCGGQGTLTKYVYNSIELYTLATGNTETVDGITFLDDAVKCPEGVGVGSTAADVQKACGSGFTKKSDSGITYVSGNKSLIFTLKDGTVSGVEYGIIG